jgi:Lon-like protease
LRKYAKIAVVLIIVVVLSSFVPTGYFLIKPGTADELGSMIQVEGEERNEDGQFYMVTVSQQPANLLSLLYGIWSPILDVRPISKVVPPNITPDEYNRIMQSWMQDSKYLAQIIALRRAGYEVPIVSDGVEIVELIPGSPAEGILKAGDIIKAVEGERVNLAEEVVEKIQEKEVGENVWLTVQQGEELNELDLPTTSHIEQPEKAALRIYVRTLNWHPLLPLNIEIETGPVLGPSAGMMFVLEILDRLVPENLTHGYRVAGTGTITLTENVGGIGGVKQKVAAAERAGIKYFLVPEENYADAMKAARKIEVVSVRNLEDALNFLTNLK